MDVIITKNYSLRNQPFLKLFGLTVGLVDADNQSRSFYKQKLQEANLEVMTFADYVEMLEESQTEKINALIFGLHADKVKQQIVHLSTFIQNYPAIPVITISKTMQENQIDAIMKLGTRLHINRNFSHPRDLLIALEQIL